MYTVMNWSYNGKSSIYLYKELQYKIIRITEDRKRKPMTTKLVNLRIDFAFKQLFRTKGNE